MKHFIDTIFRPEWWFIECTIGRIELRLELAVGDGFYPLPSLRIDTRRFRVGFHWMNLSANVECPPRWQHEAVILGFKTKALKTRCLRELYPEDECPNVYPYINEVVSKYNETFKGLLPPCIRTSYLLRQCVAQCLRLYGFEAVDDVFRYIKSDPFSLGDNKTGFKATFSFIFTPRNFYLYWARARYAEALHFPEVGNIHKKIECIHRQR